MSSWCPESQFRLESSLQKLGIGTAHPAPTFWGRYLIEPLQSLVTGQRRQKRRLKRGQQNKPQGQTWRQRIEAARRAQKQRHQQTQRVHYRQARKIYTARPAAMCLFLLPRPHSNHTTLASQQTPPNCVSREATISVPKTPASTGIPYPTTPPHAIITSTATVSHPASQPYTA